MKFIFTLFFCFTLFLGTAVFADDADVATDTARTPTYPLYDDVTLISKTQFFYDKHKVTIKAVYPEIISETADEDLDRFNQLTHDLIQNTVTQFKQQVKENQSVQKHLPASASKNDLYIDYDSSAIKSNDDHILSVRFNVEAFLAGMAHPSHSYFVLTYNLDTGEQIELDDLFNPDTNYLSLMADYARKMLVKKLNANQDMIEVGTTPTAENYKIWNIKPDGLLITFETGQVAPAVAGPQTVLIPYTVLKSVIAEDAPIQGCIKHKKQCSLHNLLTGGFIDQAINSQHRRLNPILG